MKTPYIKHTFGDEINRKLKSRRGWLTAGVASSIPWPSLDVCIEYAGDEYFLRGSEREGKPSPPGITIACNNDNTDEALSKVYRFTSILSWFLGGYVFVSGSVWGSHPILYGDDRTVYSSLGIVGTKSFSCNHMPIIEHENVRKALAFWREGKRLCHVHDSYAFLNFYKVIESQFSDSRKKVEWISAAIDKLTDRAGKRVAKLRQAGIDVSRHLFDSGRCAVAHASLEREIIDPNERKTVLLVFFLDYRSGKAHTNLEDGGLVYGENAPEEADVVSYATFFYHVLGNRIAELTYGDLEPIDCEVVIPVNIVPPNPEDAIKDAVRRFRSEQAANEDSKGD
jgi:hypothetical protein